MPDMPEVASKGSILKRLDALTRDASKRRELLADLTATPTPSIANIAEKHGLVTPLEKEHLTLDWFTNWWPAAQPVEPILAEGFKVALREAIERNLPLDFYWLCEPGHDGQVGTGHHGPTGGEGTVEVAVCWSDQQVTVLIDTPGPGHFATMPPLESIQGQLINDPILVVKRSATTGEIVSSQPKHRP